MKKKRGKSAGGMPKGRARVFTLLVLALPVLILFALELLLRLFGLFPQPPLYTKVRKQGRQVYQINQHVATRYFDPRRVTVPGAIPETFAIEKSPKTVRIFCLGGSTTAGFPFDGQVSFPQQLRYMLQQSYPERTFEVINLGISAVNSYTVLDLLPEVLKLEPDLVLIYMGHNEFYGAYGAASAFSLPGSDSLIRFYLKLQKLHLVHLLKAVLSALGGDRGTAKKNLSLMAAVVRDQQIALGSKTYTRTLTAFRNNLARILAACREENVPVIISNLISNVRDLRPFSANVTDNAGPAAEHLRRGDNLLAAGKAAAALQAYEYAWEIDSSSAGVWYGLGKAYLALGDSVRAAAFLYGAKDRDQIRFRASEETNRLIRGLAAAYEAQFLDMQEVFSRRSGSGIPGSELLCDHLHPNPNGYYLMAQAVFEAIQKLGDLGPPAPGFSPPEEPYFVTDLDWDIGLLKIYEMVHRWPFREVAVTFDDYRPHGEPKAAEIARHYLFVENVWSSAHYKMAEFYIARGEYEKARREYLAVSVFAPDDPYPYNRVAKTYELEKKWDLREAYLKKELRYSTQKGMVHYQIAISQFNQRKLRQAVDHMRAAVASSDLTHEQRLDARYYLAGFYFELQQLPDAVATLQQILREAPNYGPARAFLAKILSSHPVRQD